MTKKKFKPGEKYYDNFWDTFAVEEQKWSTKRSFFGFQLSLKTIKVLIPFADFNIFYKIKNILKFKLHDIVFSKDSFEKNTNRFQDGTLLCHQSGQKVCQNPQKSSKNS